MHLVEAIGLINVSVLRILDLLGRIAHKVVCLQADATLVSLATQVAVFCSCRLPESITLSTLLACPMHLPVSAMIR